MLFVLAVMRWLVAVSTRETLAPVIAAPEGSRTLPEIDPLVCAAAGKEAKHVKRAILAAHPAMDTDGRTGWSATYVKSKQLLLTGEKAAASAAGRIKEIIDLLQRSAAEIGYGLRHELRRRTCLLGGRVCHALARWRCVACIRSVRRLPDG